MQTSLNFDMWKFLLLEKDPSYWYWTLYLVENVLWNFSFPSDCLSVHPSVHQSVGLSLKFFKIRSLVFSHIVHDDSWPWYLVTDEARFFFKEIGSPNLGQNGPKSSPQLGFLPFCQVWFICFSWINIRWWIATISNFW